MSVDTDEALEDPGAPPPPRRRAPRLLVGAAVLVPILALVALLASGLGGEPESGPSELEGGAAPAFSLRTLGGGGTVDLESFRGQVVVLNFWASWCRPCRDEHPALLAAWDRYRERGVVVVGVVFQDSEQGALAYAEEMGGDWPLAADPGSRTAIDYGVFGIPQTFVIGPDGTIVDKIVGAVTYEWLDEHIQAALPAEADR